MNKPQELVIARYNEDISWSSNFKNIRKIYNKGDELAGFDCIQLPNVGREAHTYLYHIIHNWDNLAEQTMFCQGGAHQHHLTIEIIDLFFETPGFFKSKRLYRTGNWGYIKHIGKWAEEKSSGKMKKADEPLPSPSIPHLTELIIPFS